MFQSAHVHFMAWITLPFQTLTRRNVVTSYHCHKVEIGYIVKICENKHVLFGVQLGLWLGIKLAVSLRLGLGLGLGLKSDFKKRICRNGLGL